MVKPSLELTSVWKVCSVGLLIKADWFVIQRFFTLSKVFAKMILRLPMRTWKTGPYFFDHSAHFFAWLSPSSRRLPMMGRPGISGRFLILGTSVRSRILTAVYTTARRKKGRICGWRRRETMPCGSCCCAMFSAQRAFP